MCGSDHWPCLEIYWQFHQDPEPVFLIAEEKKNNTLLHDLFIFDKCKSCFGGIVVFFKFCVHYIIKFEKIDNQFQL